MFNFIKSLLQKWFPIPIIEKWDTGLIESPTDFRDITFGQLIKEFTPLPEEYRIPYVLTMKDQGSTPQCVAYSTTTCKENRERSEDVFVDFDPNWLYNECKKSDGIPSVRGTYFRQAMKVGKEIGFKRINEPLDDPAKFKIGGYVKVEEITVENIKRAIQRFGVVVAGFYIYAGGSWNSAYIKKTSNQVIGGHAVALVGWNKTHIIGQNSFGKDWGDNGYFYFEQSYLPYECWFIISDIPTDVIPQTEKPKHYFSTDLYFGVDNKLEVIALQDCLKYFGCMDKSQTSTGYFGTITQNAVIIFQKRYGISPVGRVGPATREKINLLLN